jgi:signal peptidase I
MADLQNSPHRLVRTLRWAACQIERCLALFGLVMLVYLAGFDLSRITSGSMEPTLRGEDYLTGDLVLTECISYWFRRPQRWEVVALRNNEGLQVMKRVVGLPGERIQLLRGGKLIVDGQEAVRPPQLEFLKYVPWGNLANNKTVPCGDGYYLLGDKTVDSEDSRFSGPVHLPQIFGRAWLILAPSAHRRFVNSF